MLAGAAMTRRTLADWLAWQDQCHPKSIDLGLDRIRRVAKALDLLPAPYQVVTVAGTNGKGSSVAYVEALLRRLGKRVGAYTSPHLVRYNERIRIEGSEASDEALVSAFEAIDAVRGSVSLSYFEFGTLAALYLFREARVDVAVLEVGLGGRLDAVNVVDPDVALITQIGLDHMAWLGPDREAIGVEKAGILRPGRPAVLSDPKPPRSVIDRAGVLGVPLRRLGIEFRAAVEDPEGRWTLQGQGYTWEALAPPGIAGAPQYANAAGAVEAVRALGLDPSRNLAEAAVSSVRLPGRLQRISGHPEWILDVAHNPDACETLAASLRAARHPGRTVALMAVLADKAPDAMAARLRDAFDAWVVGTAPGPRGLPAIRLADAVRAALPSATVCCAEPLGEALRLAREQAGPDGRVVAFGSFYAVAAVWSGLRAHETAVGIG